MLHFSGLSDAIVADLGPGYQRAALNHRPALVVPSSMPCQSFFGRFHGSETLHRFASLSASRLKSL